MTRHLQHRGEIQAISGCMMAGKTTECIRRVEAADIAGLDYEIYKPAIDTRYGEESIVGHNGDEWDATVVDSAYDIVAETPFSTDIVAIDEIQFFDPQLIIAIETLANEEITVIVSGLDRDFRGEPFEVTAHVLARAEYVEKLSAVCAECGSPATRTQKLVDGEPAPYASERVEVGGQEQYEARCREHHRVPNGVPES